MMMTIDLAWLAANLAWSAAGLVAAFVLGYLLGFLHASLRKARHDDHP